MCDTNSFLCNHFVISFEFIWLKSDFTLNGHGNWWLQNGQHNCIAHAKNDLRSPERIFHFYETINSQPNIWYTSKLMQRHSYDCVCIWYAMLQYYLDEMNLKTDINLFVQRQPLKTVVPKNVCRRLTNVFIIQYLFRFFFACCCLANQLHITVNKQRRNIGTTEYIFEVSEKCNSDLLFISEVCVFFMSNSSGEEKKNP